MSTVNVSKDFRLNGYTYTVYIRGWKENNKYEYIKYKTGFRNLWDRISKKEYNVAKQQKDKL